MPAGLIYYPDSNPGIRREKRGRGFSYINVDGTRIDCPQKRAELNALAVPPAYTDVWMAPMAHAHLLATGRDARARKQYRYHPDWAEHRARTKFEGLSDFARSLPRVRRWIDTRLDGEVGEEETAVAAVLALIDRAALRPGSSDYSERNSTYGATTLRADHVDVKGERMRLSYTGKGGKQVEKTLRGSKLAQVLHASQDLPGPSLVSWLDARGEARAVSAEQVNTQLGELCESGATAKTLRTWQGTLAAFLVAHEEGEITLKAMAAAASEKLHNTPAIAQKSYIHPGVLKLARMEPAERKKCLPAIEESSDGYRRGEEALIEFLK